MDSDDDGDSNVDDDDDGDDDGNYGVNMEDLMQNWACCAIC